MNNLRSEIIKNIRKLVDSKKFVASYAELARLIPMDATQLNKWLQGVNSFPVEFPEDCARALKVPLARIIPEIKEEVGPKKNPKLEAIELILAIDDDDRIEAIISAIKQVTGASKLSRNKGKSTAGGA